MRTLTLLCLYRRALLLSALIYVSDASLAGQALSKEYIRLNGQVIAIENAGCTLSAYSETFSSLGGATTIPVTTHGFCTSVPTPTGPSWVTISTSGNTVSITVQPDTDAGPRTATIFIAGQSFVITQQGTASLPAGLQFVPITPCRFSNINQASLTAGNVANFPVINSCGVPATAKAVSLNVSVNPPPGGGGISFLSVWAGPTSNVPKEWSFSTLNDIEDGPITNAVVTAIGADGTINAYSSDNALITVDVNGYFVPQGGLQFYPITPCRAVAEQPLTANQTANFQIVHPAGDGNPCAGSVPSTAQAFALNLTGVMKSGLDSLTAWAYGSPQPPTRNLSNPVDMFVPASAAIVQNGSGQISVNATTNVTKFFIDVTGYFAPPSAQGLVFYPLPMPCRVFDSRLGFGLLSGTVPVTVDGGGCGLPTAKAYALNTSAIEDTGYLTVWPGQTPWPGTSTLNDVYANLALTGSSNGTVAVLTNSPTDLFFDAYGYFDIANTTAASSAVATLESSSHSFGPRQVNTPGANWTARITNTGNAPLTFTAPPVLSGPNAADFSLSNGSCEPARGPFGLTAACSVAIEFNPKGEGSRSATLTFTDNASNGPTQTVSLTGTGTGATFPAFTTYLGDEGGVPSPFAGPIAILPLRASNSNGASQITLLKTFLGANAVSAPEYVIAVNSNGSGGYSLQLQNGAGTASAPAQPLAPSASGNTVVLSTPLTVATMSITAYSFALDGNEFQLDLTVTRTDTFSDQIVINAAAGSNSSQPSNAVAGQWGSTAVAGSSCNGANIATSIVVGDGAWQCWSSNVLTPNSYGNPYWNGDSGDGAEANIGGLLAGAAGSNNLPGQAPGLLGYFGSPTADGSNNMYFSSNGAPITVNFVAALTPNGPLETLGWYSIDPNHPNIVPSPATMHTLISPSTSGPHSATFTPSPYYGLFTTTPSGATYYSQPQFNSDSLQHFAVFQQSAGSYYIGTEDTNEEESDLDYNDIVATLTVGTTSAPPPPTTSLYSLSLDGNSNESTTLPNAAPFNNLTAWRMETRLHGISNLASNIYDQYVWVMYPSSISYTLSLSADGSTLNFGNYGENVGSSTANQYFCNVPLNGANDIQIRLQRSPGHQNYQLQVWNTFTAALLTTIGDCGGIFNPTASLAGPLIVGGLGANTSFKGGIAYLRIYTSAVDNANPPANAAPGGELLDYEFEDNTNLGKDTGASVPNYPLAPSGQPIRMTTPTGASTPPSVSITAPTANTNVAGMVTITATATANTAGANIASVQLKLDGVNLYSPLTSSPYSTSWNTASYSNGSHILTAVATDSLGQSTTSSQVAVTVNNIPGNYSIYFDGNSNESVDLPNAAPFNNLTSWRLETRLHGITGNWNSNRYSQFFWGIYGVYSLYITADASYLVLENRGEGLSNPFYCDVPLNGATDIQIRLQRNASAQNYQLQVWNTLTAAPLTTVGNCGTISSPTASLAGAFYLAGTGQNYQGSMAYLRIYNTAVSGNTPPSNTRPGAELLDYEFENGSNLGQETSGNAPSYQLAFTGNPTQISTPVTGLTPPSVSVTAPLANTTLSATVNIAATATANSPGAGIASVQFSVDGSNFGSPVLSSPYSIPWNTASYSNGSHIVTAIATDSLGQTSSPSQVAVTVNNAAPGGYSIYFDGNSNESATLPSAAPFNNLTSWRMESRLHGINGNGNSQYFWSIYGVYWLSISPDASYVLFQNRGEDANSPFYCNVQLNGATDIQIRLQRNAGTLNYQLQVWNTLTGGLLSAVGDCGTFSSSSSSASLAGNLVLGGTGQNYQGGMAYLRFYNTAVNSNLPPSSVRPGGELLDYEFENSANLEQETSGNTPAYPLSPSGAPTQIPTPAGAFAPQALGAIVQIAAGSPVAIGSWLADQEFSGGSTYSTTNSVDTSGPYTAPAAVYQSQRYGTFTYTLGNLTPNALYLVRLHFAEIYDTQPGQRQFNMAINGTPVLNNFDIVAQAGGPNTAIVKTFSATANSAGQIIVSSSNGAADNPSVSGISLTLVANPPNSTPPPSSAVQIAAGSPVAVGSWAVDQEFSGGGTYSTTSTINTSAPNSAPAAVYQTERYGTFTYTLGNLTAGASYTVQLHFAEIYYTQPGQRQFNMAINGTPVLSNFDIVAEAGGPNIAIVKTFTATANSSGQIVISSSNGAADSPKISGIRVALAGSSAPPSISISAPTAGSNVTGTVNITASAAANASGASIASVQLKLDGANLGSALTASPYSASWNTANSSNGSHTLTATATDSLGNSATSNSVAVTVNNTAPGNAVIQIAAGSAAAIGAWSADQQFSGGGTYSTNSAIDTSAPNSAPAAVYQNERYGTFTYTLGNLTAGTSYTVQLHFAEIYHTQPGQRQFNMAINGTPVLSNFDIVAEAGGPNIAIVKTFTATANSSGQIVISSSNGAADNPKISGILVR